MLSVCYFNPSSYIGFGDPWFRYLFFCVGWSCLLAGNARNKGYSGILSIQISTVPSRTIYTKRTIIAFRVYSNSGVLSLFQLFIFCVNLRIHCVTVTVIAVIFPTGWTIISCVKKLMWKSVPYYTAQRYIYCFITITVVNVWCKCFVTFQLVLTSCHLKNNYFIVNLSNVFDEHSVNLLIYTSMANTVKYCKYTYIPVYRAVASLAALFSHCNILLNEESLVMHSNYDIVRT